MASQGVHTHPVWLISVDHRYGTDIALHASEESAKDDLRRYVEESWGEFTERLVDHGEEPPEPPEGRDEAIAYYFDRAAEWDTPESYRLERHEVAFDG